MSTVGFPDSTGVRAGTEYAPLPPTSWCTTSQHRQLHFASLLDDLAAVYTVMREPSARRRSDGGIQVIE